MKGFSGMLVNIIVSTIDAGIRQVEKILLEPRPDLKYIISHQFTESIYRPIPDALKRNDIAISQIEGRGLSRNRNKALSLADGDIGVLADDDVIYRNEYINTVLTAYRADPDLGAACFKIATPAGEPEYKDYYTESYLLNEKSHHYLSTLEITFNLKKIRDNNIRFDERFGMGSELNIFGEEAVFIFDCIKKGLKVRYLPEYIVEHKSTSTIKSLEKYSVTNNIFKGAYDARRYGWLAFPAAFYGTIRFWGDISRDNKNPLRYLRERLQGVIYIYKTSNT
jgi:glycosyltransferase involved in cell wall biosynthesis